MSTVYLAGGFKSGWQNKIQETKDRLIIDPSKKERTGEWNITIDFDRICSWDKLAIQKSDIIFSYLEKDNPSGIGLACEIGYARALGKTIILVDEKQEKKFDFLRGFADYVTNDFQKGLDFLDILP